ncbi:hypothetical protein HELRODRAFT_188929 [Helobdella robusta]|uniref:LIM interaction domain-containing protein n=1 Tax=Helobdella robusta TaxID=6412 RepID=T1FQH6_HELRO|nr:hypothetical protein HELRODRAFT_188929 [Helobdella robusta]ESN98853.1 hypothetical protein HELRODRAFT_188929 [Helobdella robusta]
MPVQQIMMPAFDRDMSMMHRMSFIGQPDFRIYEMNRRLQQWSQDVDNLWWDTFVTEFFEDDATLTLAFYLEDGLKKYTIGRTLIPRYFRSIFEGGVVELFFVLKYSKEICHNQTIILDCEHASMITQHTRPIFTKVLAEGRLVLEMTYDDLMRIRMWHFSIHHHYELIPRSIVAMQQQDPAIAEHLSMNVTRQGLTNYTLNFLRLCVILEPMQELMSRHKAYGLSPRDCLKTTLFQKWQKMVAPPDANKQTNKRKKRKVVASSTSSGGTPTSISATNSTASTSNNNTPNNNPHNKLNSSEVMVVGEPTLMGGEFGDKDERLIARLENSQYEPGSEALPSLIQNADVNGSDDVNPLRTYSTSFDNLNHVSNDNKDAISAIKNSMNFSEKKNLNGENNGGNYGNFKNIAEVETNIGSNENFYGMIVSGGDGGNKCCTKIGKEHKNNNLNIHNTNNLTSGLRGLQQMTSSMSSSLSSSSPSTENHSKILFQNRTHSQSPARLLTSLSSSSMNSQNTSSHNSNNKPPTGNKHEITNATNDDHYE